jgi:hypothetical protein
MNSDSGKLNSQPRQVIFILFMALSFENVIFGVMINSGLIKGAMSDSGAFTLDDLLLPKSYGLFLGLLIAICNYIFFTKIIDVEKIKEALKNGDFNKNPQFEEQKSKSLYETASESEQIEYNIRSSLMTKYIILWSINTVISVIAIMCVIAFNMPNSLAYTMLGLVVVMQLLMRPQVNVILSDVLGKNLF